MLKNNVKFLQKVMFHTIRQFDYLSNNLRTRRPCFIIGAFVFLFSLNSCKIASNFPLTIDDIDTLSVFEEQHSNSTLETGIDSTIVSDSTMVRDSSALALQSGSTPNAVKLWTICAGVFNEEPNAKRMYEHLSHFGNVYLIKRDSSYFVTVGSFTTRDSAQQFRNNKALTGTYVMKLRPKELYSGKKD